MRKVLFLLFFAGAGLNAAAQETRVSLNHIALYVQDLQKATVFYRDFLGLDTIPEPFHDGKHTWFSVGPKSHLHLIAGAKSKQQGDINTHICFSVASVEAFIERLKKAGIPYRNWQGEKNKMTLRVDGVKQIYLQDPDGYWVEVNDARS
ncbi:VOC family protein [Chitinophaga sp. XS-30]|uniref:VOC family protein n=1 Tax=Chitinophaga sp. XS-30 TaxID=2604421 RepID=UPI0011DDC772|nr:VOC family protein [Chitinophaga sp. XS-30]QEH40797.1 VOC family protein [Chitinophaga sp. XS-30]